ncbi:unnamed protein product, partial [marine sediment metagenome]
MSNIIRLLKLKDYITLSGTICGIFALMVGILLNDLSLAFFFIMICQGTDLLDGYVARKLNQVNKIGKEMDSLNDLFCFGVVPAMLIFIGYCNDLPFELLDDGTKNELDTSPEELGSILDPNQVFVIVREDLRRIFIWKGSKSPVRKRFISSRVAQELQNELIKSAGFHRCIIKSIDQGDELVEFLNAFGLESMEVTERLPDMRYIRNIERDGMAQGIIMDAT